MSASVRYSLGSVLLVSLLPMALASRCAGNAPLEARTRRGLWLSGLLLLSLTGCATVRTLDAAKPGAPVIYAGTRLDWYAVNGGCCPLDRFGAEAPRYAGLDMPASALLDTLLLPFSLATALGVNLGVSGGL